MNIKKEDVDKIIKEEFQKIVKKKKLASRLSEINEELKKMDSEDSLLNEVEAGEKTSVASHAWTGEENGDVKWKPEFEKKGSALKEDDMTGEEVPEMGEFEAKFAEIGKAIDAKLAAETPEEEISVDSAEMGGDDDDNSGNAEANDDDFEEVEVEPETGSEEIEEVMDAKVGEEQHLTPEKAEKIDEPTNNLKGEVQQESVEEPIEGKSVAQEVEADKVNDNMEKDTHVKESVKKDASIIKESKNIFTEGVDAKRKTALLEELNRMKKFAGLTKEEE